MQTPSWPCHRHLELLRTASQKKFSELVRRTFTCGSACRLRNGVTGRGLVPEGREITSFIQPRLVSGVQMGQGVYF